MKVVILAGGLGTRLAEETETIPKPMVEIGGRPILWHILKHYAHYGFGEFIIALGYKSHAIKRYFQEYHCLNGDMTVSLGTGQVRQHDQASDDWTVHLVDTGATTQTGGRVNRLKPWLDGGTFMVTYGDGVANVDLGALLRFHRHAGRTATVTAVRPPARFGGLVLDGDLVSDFSEKAQVGEGWINGGYLVLEPAIFDYIGDDAFSLERDGLEKLAAAGQLAAYRHSDFWQCMDTLRDKRQLEDMWQRDAAAWKVWR